MNEHADLSQHIDHIRSKLALQGGDLSTYHIINECYFEALSVAGEGASLESIYYLAHTFVEKVTGLKW